MVDIADVTASLVHLSRVVTNMAKNNAEQADLLYRTVNSVLLLQERVDELESAGCQHEPLDISKFGRIVEDDGSRIHYIEVPYALARRLFVVQPNREGDDE